MKKTVLTVVLAAGLLAAQPVISADLKVTGGDSIESVLHAQVNRRVTLRLRSGQELTGIVRLVTAKIVHLGAVSGREFFDAIVSVDAIEAVIVRTRDS